MSLYQDIFDAVVTWTSRPKMVAETNLAISQAVRKAHRAGMFPRDLAVTTLSGVPTNAEGLQVIDLSASVPNYRQLAYVKPSGQQRRYTAVGITDLFDQDKYYRTDVFYIVGANLVIRPAGAADSVDICFYTLPNTSPITALDSWIAVLHPDLIVLWAAATVLALVGEQEIKQRVELLVKPAYTDLIAESLLATGS